MASTSLGVMEQSIALTDDPAALRPLIAAQRARLEIEVERETQRSELAAARAGLIEQRLEIELLKAKLARALRVAFGRSSEKLRTQLELTLADLDELLAETTENADTADSNALAAGKPVRRPLPPALPRDVRDDRPFGGSDPPAVLYRYSPDRALHY